MTKLIKMILGYRGMMISDLAKKLGTSRPNLSQKLTRDNFSESEMREIAKALDCDLKITFIDHETGKEF